MNPLDEWVIACRTYDRSEEFVRMTYRTLEMNRLTDRLYIFVANEEEKEKYKTALGDKPYKEIVVGEKGINQIMVCICNYFPVNQRILFLDDDVSYFYAFSETKVLTRQSDTLKQYADDGFATIDKYNCGAFSVGFTHNKMYLEGKPWKEISPQVLVGGFFGARNNKELICDLDSGGIEDFTRSIRYWEQYGGICKYWYCGMPPEHCNKLRGGLQTSKERDIELTKKQSQNLLDTYQSVRDYCDDKVYFQERYNKYTIHFKNITKRKKQVLQKHPSMKFLTWAKPWQQEPDA